MAFPGLSGLSSVFHSLTSAVKLGPRVILDRLPIAKIQSDPALKSSLRLDKSPSVKHGNVFKLCRIAIYVSLVICEGATFKHKYFRACTSGEQFKL